MVPTIADISAVTIDLPSQPMTTEPRREAWTASGPVANPMTRYPRYADYRPAWLPDWEGVGCLVEATDGTVGLGMTSHGPPVAALIDGYLGPRLVGENALATEKVYDMAVRLCSPFGRQGLSALAISAIDLALWDLKGHRLDLPVYELAGGPSHDELPCYATGNDTDWHLELGFEATKMACPYGPADGRDGLEATEALVAEKREMVGDHVDLMLDCWMALDVEYTVRLASRLEPYDVRWMEEPLPPTALQGLAELRDRLPAVALAMGEHWYTPETFQAAAYEGLVDVLQPDIQWVGGLTAMKRIAAIADAAGVALIPHAGGNTPYGQHACAALPAIPWVEFFIGSPPGVPLDETDRLPGMAVPDGGWLAPSDEPGFGIDRSALDIELYGT